MLADERRTGRWEAIGHVRRIDGLGAKPRRAVRSPAGQADGASSSDGRLVVGGASGVDSVAVAAGGSAAGMGIRPRRWSLRRAYRRRTRRSPRAGSPVAGRRAGLPRPPRTGGSRARPGGSRPRPRARGGGSRAGLLRPAAPAPGPRTSDGASSGYSPLIHDRRRFREAGLASRPQRAGVDGGQPGDVPILIGFEDGATRRAGRAAWDDRRGAPRADGLAGSVGGERLIGHGVNPTASRDLVR